MQLNNFEEEVKRELFLREQRDNDFRVIAALPEGRRILGAMVHDDVAIGGKFMGDNRDFYQEGRRHVAAELREELKGILPREAFIQIVCPVEE